MDRMTIIKKNRILAHVSRKQYRELLFFVEKIYLADYSLKILVARKGSNLFNSLIDLVREEDGGRVRRLYEAKFKGKPEPVIISDRALDYYTEEIRAGSYSSILIADDTIRRGKTVFGLYDRVNELLGEGNVGNSPVIYAFATCKNEMSDIKGVEMKVDKSFVDLGEYRMASDMIIDIFSLAGQPYTSYVPNVELQKESPLYQKAACMTRTLLKQKTDEGDGFDQKRLNLCSARYVDPNTLNFAMFQSIRLYLYGDAGVCTLVPMVSLLPICEETLWNYCEILKNVISTDYYKKVPYVYSELSYRMVIYVVSSLYLRLYIRQELHYEGTLPVLENAEVEKLNFGGQVLDQQKLGDMRPQDIAKILKNLESTYKRIDLDEISNLDTDIKDLHDELTQKMSDALPQYTDSYVKRFFSISGDRNSRNDNQCVYPFVCLASQLNGQENGGRFYDSILEALDYGRGSIVARERKKGDKTYYLPFLVAGERNYKYKEEKYFPILYGLLEIERKSAEKGIDSAKCKEKFLEQISKPEEYDAMRDKEEWEELCGLNITAQYKSILLEDVWFYAKKTKLNETMHLVNEIMQ